MKVIAASATVLALASVPLVVVLTSDDARGPRITVQACDAAIVDVGRIAASGADCRLRFIVPRPDVPSCTMRPLAGTDIAQQWSFEATELELVVRGLKPGDVVDFDCTGRTPAGR
jgi:hypothetical protein